MGKYDKNKRFIDDNKNISDDKIIFLKAISNVIKTGMNIVGVSTPEKM
jgi:arginyl-tRNA synthetase